MRPDFSKIEYRPEVEQAKAREKQAPESSEWLSPEHIPVKSFYTREDLQ